MYRHHYTMSSTDFHQCSLTSLCSMSSADTLGSCFRSQNSRKRERRRVSFAQDMERVQIVENFRLTLSTSEKELFWPTAKEDILEDTLLICFGAPVERAPVEQHSNLHNKRRRRKSKSTPPHKSIFGDISTSPKQQKQRSTKKSTQKSERQSPLQALRKRLWLRRERSAKKVISTVPLH